MLIVQLNNAYFHAYQEPLMYRESVLWY